MVKLLSKIFSKTSTPKKHDDGRASAADVADSAGVGYIGERDGNGLRSGWGRFVFQSGDTYEGEWYENMKHGFGDAFYCSGSRYRGDWHQDCKHGKGVFVFGHDGSSYTGDWQDDKKTGFGVAVFRTGNRYAGQWEGDCMHGRGRFVYASGDAYEGDWVRNRKSGFGTWTSADSSCTYAGEWRDDLRHGAGLFVDAHGVVFEVTYRNGDLMAKTVPKRPLPPPAAVDRSVPEPPYIPPHPRCTSSPIKVPRGKRLGNEVGGTSPTLSTQPVRQSSASSSATSCPPSRDVYGSPAIPMGTYTTPASRGNSASGSGNASVVGDTTHQAESAGEEALLSRLRAWRRTAPAPPVPDLEGVVDVPYEIAVRQYERAPESTWGARSSNSEGGNEHDTVAADIVGKHADLSLEDCDDRFDAPTSDFNTSMKVTTRDGRSGSVLSGMTLLDDLPV